MTYENLLLETEKEGIDILEMKFKGNSKGLYSDNTIALSVDIDTIIEKHCVLATVIVFIGVAGLNPLFLKHSRHISSLLAILILPTPSPQIEHTTFGPNKPIYLFPLLCKFYIHYTTTGILCKSMSII